MESHNLCSSINRSSTILDMNSTTQRSSQDHHTARDPYIFIKIINVGEWGGGTGGCSPQAFQTRVLPVCKWMPALLGNVFFKRLTISRVRPGDNKMNTSSRNAKRNSPGSGKLLHLFHRIVQTETEQRWHEVTLFRPLHDVQCCATRHPRPPTRASLVARVQLWQTVSNCEETAPPTVSTASCSETR